MLQLLNISHLVIWSIVAVILFFLAKLFPKFQLTHSHIKNLSIIFGIIFAASITTYWIMLWQASVLPAYVNIAITRPDNGIVTFQEEISVTVSPFAERVYILIHPLSTSIWYLQDTFAKQVTTITDESSIPKEQIWVMNVQFGERVDSDCDSQFDILALASRDNIWLDKIRGRILTESSEIDMLQETIPSLNRSTQLVVTKVCK